MTFCALALSLAVAFIIALSLAYPVKYARQVRLAADANGLDEALVAAVARCESGFRPNAVSRRGAVGIMQLMPETAEWISEREGVKTYDLTNPNDNIALGAAYLKYLFTRFSSMEWVLAAYNAGEGNVRKWQAEGIPVPFAETREYIKKVTSAYEVYKLRLQKTRLPYR